MEAALLQQFNPEEYHRRFLSDGLRPDGRAPQQRRPARLRAAAIAGSAHGSASARLGRSAAVAGVRAEVTEASPDLPVQGHVTASVELPPLCAAGFRDRHASVGAATFLASALNDVLNSPHVLDAAQLHVREGELFWTLHVHVVCLNYDGNAFDLCLLAALAALEDTSLPALGEDPSAAALQEAAAGSGSAGSGPSRRLVEVPVGCAGVLAEARRVALKSRPLPVTFAQLPGDVWVVDPSGSEESLGATVSLCLVGGKWLVYHQGGGASADRVLSELMPVARSCMPVLTELLEGVRAASVAGDGDHDMLGEV